VPLQKKDEPLSMLVQLSYQLHANSISKTEIEFHFSFLISLLGEISFFLLKHNSRPADLTGQAIGRAPKSSSLAEGGKQFHLHSTTFEPRMKFGEISPVQVYQKKQKGFPPNQWPRASNTSILGIRLLGYWCILAVGFKEKVALR
jgi:hypothetical protein